MIAPSVVPKSISSRARYYTSEVLLQAQYYEFELHRGIHTIGPFPNCLPKENQIYGGQFIKDQNKITNLTEFVFLSNTECYNIQI